MNPGHPLAAGAPRVGVVILNWNGYEVTRRCLTSLRAAIDAGRTVYLVDNGSTDGSLEKLTAEFSPEGVVFLSNAANLGFSAGNNPGIRRALADGCDFVLLLNNDTVCIAPDFIERGVARAESRPDIGLVGGKIVCWPETSRLWSVGGEVGWMSERFLGLGEPDRGQFDAPADRTFISGAMMLIRRAVLESVGLLPEEYFFGGEDREYGVRVAGAGFRLVYEPRFLVAHEAGGSHATARVEFIYNEAVSRILFRKRNFSPWSYHAWRVAYAIYLEVLLPLRHALRRGEFQPGIEPAALRKVLRDALRDSRHLERTTERTILDYRDRYRG